MAIFPKQEYDEVPCTSTTGAKFMLVPKQKPIPRDDSRLDELREANNRFQLALMFAAVMSALFVASVFLILTK